MNNFVPIISTVLATFATLIYTFYSVLLWRTTRASAEISRQSAFVNLWTELNRYLSQQLPPDAFERPLLEEFQLLLTTSMIRTLLNTGAANNHPEIKAFKQQLRSLLDKYPEQAARVSWLQAALDGPLG